MQPLTLEQIGNHLGISKQAVAKVLSKLQIDWREKALDEVRLAYCARLREVAAGQASIDGEYDLNKERAMTERVDRELKTLQLAEKRRQLVNIGELMTELENVFTAFRQELLARDDKLKLELDTLYGTDIDVTILNEHTYNALHHLSGYLAGNSGNPEEARAGNSASGEDGNHGVGGSLPGNEREVNGNAGQVQRGSDAVDQGDSRSAG